MARNAVHDSFTLERRLAAKPERVFAAWSRIEAKSRWFAGGEDWTPLIREMDFRIGGRERLKGSWPSGMVSDFQATYQDIVPNERLIYVYGMAQNDVRISVSLATVTLKPEMGGTLMTVTEQGVFLDGYDDNGSRAHGTGILMDRLEASLG